MARFFKNKRKVICTIIGIISFTSILLVGCSSKETKEPSISEIKKNIEDSVDISEMEKKDEKSLEKLYEIKGDEIEDFILYTANSNIKSNELLILKAKDEKEISNIKDKISTRIESQSKNFKDYLPDEYYLIEKHVLEVKDKYIIFAISEESETIEDIFIKSFQ